MSFYFSKYGGEEAARKAAVASCYERSKDAGMLRNMWRRVDNLNTGDSYIEVKLTKGIIMQVDEQDLPLVEAHVWCASLGYAMRSGPNRTIIRFHRLICPDVQDVVDHIDGQPWNNRRHNLRAVTQMVNMHNHKRRSDNKTGVNGILARKKGYMVRWREDRKLRSRYFGTRSRSLDEAWRLAVEFRTEKNQTLGYIIRDDHPGKRPHESVDTANDDDLPAPPPAKRQRAGQIDDYFTKPSSAAIPLPQ
jgi:hypothetical protein